MIEEASAEVSSAEVRERVLERYKVDPRDYRRPWNNSARQWLPGIVAWSIASLGVFALLYWAIFTAPELLGTPTPDLDALDPKDKAANEIALITAKNGIRTSLLQAVGGVALLTTAFFAWRQVLTSRLGQQTTRFSDSITQIGSDDTVVRLGGIYTLEQLSRDRRFSMQAARVLLALIRNPPKQAEDISPKVSEGSVKMGRLGQATIRVRSGVPEHGPNGQPHLGNAAQRLDIQAAAAIVITDGLWRRTFRGPIDLDSAILTGIDLPTAGLRGASLFKADLAMADLRESDLSEADARQSDLRRAYLQKARLDSTWLQEAHLEGAHLEDAEGVRPSFEGAWLAEAHLEGVKFERPVFDKCRQESPPGADGPYFMGATLSLARFVGSDLSRADFSNATLVDADFTNATLTGAKFEGCTLTRATLPKHLKDSDVLNPAKLIEPIWVDVSTRSDVAPE